MLESLVMVAKLYFLYTQNKRLSHLDKFIYNEKGTKNVNVCTS